MESAARHVTDDQGHFWNKDLVAELHHQVTRDGFDPALLAHLLHLGTQQAVAGYTNGRAPKLRNGTTFYGPHSIMKLGKGERVWMTSATPRDIPPWTYQDRRNAYDVANASAARQSYGKDRLASFRRHPEYQTLDALERGVYGYAGQQALDTDPLP